MSTYQTQYQNRSEPPFPLYPSVVPTNHTNHDIDDDDDHDKGESSQWSLDDPRNTTTPTLEQGWNSVVQLLRGRKRIAILTGAGISVSCGIPDFRTKGSGLYSTLDTAVCRVVLLLVCVLIVSHRISYDDLTVAVAILHFFRCDIW